MPFLQKLSIFLGTFLLLFLLTAPNTNAQSCVPWKSGYTAKCIAPPEEGTLGDAAVKNCPPDTKGIAECKTTPDCSSQTPPEACCQWKCEPITEESDDCSGFCVPVSQCEPGTWPAPASSDPSEDGSCKSTPNSVCCDQLIVTPEGEAPGTAATDAGEEEVPDDPSIGTGCREGVTGLIFPCVARGSPSQVVVGLVQRVVNWLLALSGTLFLIMFVWGGFQFIISSGDSAKADKGRKTLVNAVMGVAIILFSYVFLDYIFGAFVTALGK